MKKVMAFGAFDILHKGHEHYLKEAKNYGDYLIVLVARDQNIAKIKGKKAVHNELFRLEQIVKLDFVDEAVLGDKSIGSLAVTIVLFYRILSSLLTLQISSQKMFL